MYRHPQGFHTFNEVYNEMLIQICRLYSSLPDVRTLKGREIKYFYTALIPELKETTKPRTN